MFLKTVHRTRLRTGRHLLQGFALAHITNNKLLFAAAYLAAFHQTRQGKIFSDATFLDDLRHELLYAFPPVGSSNTFVMSDWEMAIRFLTIPLELSFGPDSEYHDRMEDLQAVIARRGGLYSPTIPQVVRDFALSCGHDVPMYARIKPFFLPAKVTEGVSRSESVLRPHSGSAPRGVSHVVAIALVATDYHVLPFGLAYSGSHRSRCALRAHVDQGASGSVESINVQRMLLSPNKKPGGG